MKTHDQRKPKGPGGFDPDIESPTAVVEFKRRLPSVRELRNALVQLTEYLTYASNKQAILVLTAPKISPSTISEQYTRYLEALRPEISKHLHVIVWQHAQEENKPAGISSHDWQLIRERAEADASDATVLSRPDLQSEVLRVLIRQWFLGRGPVTSKWIEDTVGCSYRTVAATTEALGRIVKRHTDRRIELRDFPKDAWAQLLAVAESARATIRYQDPSDQPRTAESLAKRLGMLKRADVAIAGVIGTKRYYPDLDLTHAPRLDLSIHCPGKTCDLSFVERLDPALERTRDRHIPARLVIHFLRRKEALFDADDQDRLWADPVECLLDLHEARLEEQALAFFEYLSSRARSFNE